MCLLTALLIALAVAVVVLARVARRYGKARVAALNRNGWEIVPGHRHCFTVDGPRYPNCPLTIMGYMGEDSASTAHPLTIIETRARWERVRAAEIRRPPPRRLPAQRLRRR